MNKIIFAIDLGTGGVKASYSAELSVPAAAASSLGTAIAVGVGTGVCSSYLAAAKKIKRVTAYNQTCAELYEASKHEFAALYPVLKEIYRM